ncbi:serine/threonine protein kinase [Streptomyces sp. SCA3-4]|uniref:serine/threonine-protein kinase n=1 Tax=Streptomyces sichuanensis TaxID=2871810 RepID=UPI001CE2781B|nr:serine/threonine-protein kinase [Streptomyces sichuanensis]MCA6095302.1 serine/threonine protein kinase [Streptomyces sichuanensis]
MLVAGRYRLGELLGRGGMGEVWHGHDEVLGRQVAVKLMLGDDGDESAPMRFQMEAQTAARLNHPQVVAVYDFGAWEGRFYLVMELVRGPSLAAELSAQGRLPVRRVASLAAQTASGLAAAHEQGVVHRDVKPGNLMVDEATGALKIGDFGIARFVDETSAGLTRAGQIVGTSTYLAPERALGRTAGPESDVYALGCVLYQLLVGRPPFWSDNPTTLLYMHVDSRPESPRLQRGEVPYAFEAFLMRMLAKTPEERPSAQEVADFFAGPSWEDSAQPLPPAAVRQPAAVPPRPVVTPPPSAGPVAPAAPPAPPARGEATTAYAVPSRAGRKRRLLFGVAAGTAVFAVAALVGTSLFGSDGDGGGSRPPSVPGADLAPGTDAEPDDGKAKHGGTPHRGSKAPKPDADVDAGPTKVGKPRPSASPRPKRSPSSSSVSPSPSQRKKLDKKTEGEERDDG